ncbi:hypothetical protein C1H46_045921 [Malus baccata]|uniref:Uncharacterized protein n=1 Tax=Malus baccata TaxID=106549 RepID=A0A540K2M7_MALBA|nr:hypothetical protein C1H46_045921 [Malus baccata]
MQDLFIQSLQSVGLYTESLKELLEVIQGHYASSNEVDVEDLNLPGLTEQCDSQGEREQTRAEDGKKNRK